MFDFEFRTQTKHLQCTSKYILVTFEVTIDLDKLSDKISLKGLKNLDTFYEIGVLALTPENSTKSV